jgi:hypothetical protein
MIRAGIVIEPDALSPEWGRGWCHLALPLSSEPDDDTGMTHAQRHSDPSGKFKH